MVTTARRRDPADGRTLRIVDESFWSRERDMLSLRLSLLHDFLSAKGLTSDIQLHAEECRYLEYQIQSIHASLARTGTSLPSPLPLLTSSVDKIDHASTPQPATASTTASNPSPPPTAPSASKTGSPTTKNSKPSCSPTNPRARDGDAEDGDGAAAVVVGGKYKCCELGCKHYVYGFETVEALRRHMGLHEDAEEARREDV
ncbi:hypothetical protein VE04_09920, partial [Pseudogymnoascus sp. 24MN13]